MPALGIAISFYIRPKIGQKTWRVLHFINFATYAMGFLHGMYSGTDGFTQWAHWYYPISGASLTGLLAYRIYDALLKKFSFREFVSQRVQTLAKLRLSITFKRYEPKVTSVPHALLREQALRKVVAVAATTPNVPVPATAPAPAQVIQAPVQEVPAVNQAVSVPAPAPAAAEQLEETVVIKKIQPQTPEKREPAIQPQA
ncbi:MAG: hypothetical protein ABI986_13940, partial [Chloroflexota bacterium]